MMTLGSTLNTREDVKVNGRIFDFLEDADVTSLAVASTNTVRTASMKLPKNSTFGWAVQFSSGGTINVDVELEQSLDGSNWVVPDNKTVEMFANVADSNLHITAYSPVATPYARLKLTGVGANAASTQIDLAQCFVVRS